MLYSYSFANVRRDLSEIFSTVIKDEPRFISNFKTTRDATARLHEWVEDQLGGRSVTATAIASGVLTVSSADAAKLRVGALLVMAGDSALFAVSAISGTSITVTLAAANGSGTTVATLPTTGGTFNIVSLPMAEGTANGDGEESGSLGKVVSNATQIFRKEIIITGSALSVNLVGAADNQVNRQTAVALAELARDLNRVALFGRKVQATAGQHGEAGGLYYFAGGTGGLCVNASGEAISTSLINDAAQKVMAEGGEPTQILCSPGQARVISNEFKTQVRYLPDDDRSGRHTARVINEINGRGLSILADPDLPDTDAWILDISGFGIANLQGRAISDTDSTPRGFDGIRRTALGELTFEFRNACQRCCRIKGLKSSDAALAGLR